MAQDIDESYPSCSSLLPVYPVLGEAVGDVQLVELALELADLLGVAADEPRKAVDAVIGNAGRDIAAVELACGGAQNDGGGVGDVAVFSLGN